MNSNDDRPCRVVLVRHASAEGQGRLLGHQDPSLSVRGRRELPRLVAKLAGYDIEAVYCSDLRRARSTARAIARAAQLAMEIRPGLREMHFGHWEGRSWQEVARITPRAARLWLKHFPKHRAPGGEAFGVFKRRALRELNQTVSKNRGRCVAVVSHGGVTRIALARALGMPDGHLFRLAQEPCAVNVIDYFRDGAVVHCVIATHQTIETKRCSVEGLIGRPRSKSACWPNWFARLVKWAGFALIWREQPNDQANSLLKNINGTQFMDIGEFGRPVHAEMAAIIDGAHRGVVLHGHTMFVTTFLRHNCAKHIIAADLTRVVYLEPYPKSRASVLHKEEIVLDRSDDKPVPGKVVFSAFSGIAPRKYREPLSMAERGAKKGRSISDWESAKRSLSPLHVVRNAAFAYLEAERQELETLTVARSIKRLWISGRRR